MLLHYFVKVETLKNVTLQWDINRKSHRMYHIASSKLTCRLQNLERYVAVCVRSKDL